MPAKVTKADLQKAELPLYNENEKLGSYPREELEKEVHRLRTLVNTHHKAYNMQLRHMNELMGITASCRDVAEASPQTALVKREPLTAILAQAGKRALGGGLPGAAAMVVQVLSLMWLRTTMNYQYRHGTSTLTALKYLHSQGGIPRFYQGVVPALIQGPLSRFGDTAANAGAFALLESYDTTRNLPSPVKTVFASASAGLWRICLMPVDTCKTVLQVEGAKGWGILHHKYTQRGVPAFYQGALAASGATFVGHYPFFATHNYLQENLSKEGWGSKHVRNAFIGFCSAVVSDTSSNAIRVIKTTKQSHEENISYGRAVREVLNKDGWVGLFGRGLKTRLITNGLQGVMFTVIWRALQDKWDAQAAAKKKAQEDAKKVQAAEAIVAAKAQTPPDTPHNSPDAPKAQ
eukprot:TRINITY_DN67689_c11_g2_i1.p1 TRINITY_DN67689_c11_g2~~TRINITY_DN67689_c11_g2_i1.p1  ORF type:complete len:405 (+),score=37.44 TRINITY_DN67689_c11_g2_i1:77-1291(+)